MFQIQELADKIGHKKGPMKKKICHKDTIYFFPPNIMKRISFFIVFLAQSQQQEQLKIIKPDI